MATHWCIVMWPSEGRITVQPFVPVYLADNLFEGDANMNEIVASLQCMFLATKKTLSLTSVFKWLSALWFHGLRLLCLIRCDLWTSRVIGSLLFFFFFFFALSCQVDVNGELLQCSWHPLLYNEFLPVKNGPINQTFQGWGACGSSILASLSLRNVHAI